MEEQWNDQPSALMALLFGVMVGLVTGLLMVGAARILFGWRG
jgi:hypothetical protein